MSCRHFAPSTWTRSETMWPIWPRSFPYRRFPSIKRRVTLFASRSMVSAVQCVCCCFFAKNPNLPNVFVCRYIDLISKKKKVKKVCTLHFYCSNRGEYCLFSNNPFEIVTVHPATWIHITFLSIQVGIASRLASFFTHNNLIFKKEYTFLCFQQSTLPIGLSQQDPLFVRMKSLYDSLNEKLELVALLTSAFPSEKVIF